MTTHNPAVNPDPLLSVPEAADYIAASATYIYRATGDGTLPAVRLGRALRIRRSALDAYINRAEQGGHS